MKNKAYCLRVLDGTQQTRGPHTDVVGRKRREGSLTWGHNFIGFKGGVSRILWVHFLLVKFKT